MNDQTAATTLIQGTQARTLHTATVAPTYPMSGSTSGDRDALQAARIELLNGNVDAAIRSIRVISGKSARLGNKQAASLLRNAAWIAPFGQIDSASDLFHQAEAAL